LRSEQGTAPSRFTHPIPGPPFSFPVQVFPPVCCCLGQLNLFSRLHTHPLVLELTSPAEGVALSPTTRVYVGYRRSKKRKKTNRPTSPIIYFLRRTQTPSDFPPRRIGFAPLFFFYFLQHFRLSATLATEARLPRISSYRFKTTRLAFPKPPTTTAEFDPLAHFGL
jgi:hypothetical protein